MNWSTQPVAYAGLEHGVSQRRACHVMDIRSTVRYRSVRPDEAELRKAIRGIAQERTSSVIDALVLC